MPLAPDVRGRILAAAEELHRASRSGEFPTVEAVRQLSRAGMNNVVEVMKAWRQHQRQQMQVVREPIPAPLHVALEEMGARVWEKAQELANESLQAARMAFDAEKADLAQLSDEQSQAYDLLTAELERVRTEAAQGAQRAADDVAQLRAELAKSQMALAEARERAAGLAGQLKATQAQVEALLGRLAQREQPGGKDGLAQQGRAG